MPASLIWTAATVLSTGIIGLLAWLDARWKTAKPALQMAPTPFNRAVVAQCPTLHEPYVPLPFLTNGHVETIFAAKTRRTPHITYRRECLGRPDGGVVALDWELFTEPAKVRDVLCCAVISACCVEAGGPDPAEPSAFDADAGWMTMGVAFWGARPLSADVGGGGGARGGDAGAG